jgi:hypothetical protein
MWLTGIVQQNDGKEKLFRPGWNSYEEQEKFSSWGVQRKRIVL